MTMIRHFLGIAAMISAAVAAFAQQPAPTPAESRLEGFERHKALVANSLIAQLPATNIGPSIFSCRVTDVDVNPADPTEMYVAYASGGLWHTINNGTSF
ncbi:MAG TPA: hypothetical protein PLW66_14045, partial [Saprospiraceae bacterium]|nr:hypothetical protein [Saprospiraceae bacterium]